MHRNVLSQTNRLRRVLLVVSTVAGAVSAHANTLEWETPDARHDVEAKRTIGHSWEVYKASRYIDVFDDDTNQAEAERSSFGGRSDRKYEATGFFRVEEIDGRWWMIDPLGHPMVHVGLGAVYRKGLTELPDQRQAQLGYADDRNWADAATHFARQHGFTGFGRWSEVKALNKAGQPMPYVTSLQVMANFARTLSMTYPKYGHVGYQGGVIPVFHPDFPTFAQEYAKKNLAESIDDPYLLGHYTDNELPVSRTTLDKALRLDAADAIHRYQYEEAWSWLRDKYGRGVTVDRATPEDNMEFLGHVMDTYYRITSEAIRSVDPNHLILGSRLHGAGHKMPPVIAAAGRHCDVISINLYSVWEPYADQMAMWRKAGQGPVLISEMYIRGEDAGLPDDKGAGGMVRTQADRALWYENFTLQLLRSGGCVGWDYFKYRDDTDQNKGVLQHDWSHYPEYTEAMRKAHELIYPLIDRLDAIGASDGFGDAEAWQPTTGSKIHVMSEER